MQGLTSKDIHTLILAACTFLFVSLGEGLYILCFKKQWICRVDVIISVDFLFNVAVSYTTTGIVLAIMFLFLGYDSDKRVCHPIFLL